jgi:hypothetical protein
MPTTELLSCRSLRPLPYGPSGSPASDQRHQCPAPEGAIREKVETFDAFTPDNDPHGEHDFGELEHNGDRLFWKIDYYDSKMTTGSEDPADPKQTVRLLTIMLASEY